MEAVEVKEYVNKDMLIGETIMKYPEAVYILMECGMGCVGCPASQMESLAEAAAVHGLDPDEMVRYVNERLEEEFALKEENEAKKAGEEA